MAIAVAQVGGNNTTVGGSYVTASMTGGVAGNLVLFAVASYNGNTAPTAANFSGTNIGTITMLATKYDTTHITTTMCWATITGAGSYSLTYTQTQSGDLSMGVIEISGANTSTPVDAQNSNSATASANANTGSIAVATGEILVAVVGSDATAPTIPSGYTNVFTQSSTTYQPLQMCYYMPAASSYTPTWTNASDDWAAIGASIKVAGGGAQAWLKNNYWWDSL